MMTKGHSVYLPLFGLRAKARRREKVGQPHYLCAFAASRERTSSSIDASASLDKA